MRSLTSHEKRTIRIGGAVIIVYLLVFGGMRVWKSGEHKRAEYQQLVREAQGLKQEIQFYEAKALKVQKLMDGFKLDPARLSRTTAVAEASSAIQKAATGSGIQVGPVRESPARPSSKELASVALECVGPVPSITAFFSRLETVGFPLIIENVQLTQEAGKPGQVKASFTIVILDFEQWKKEGGANA